VAIGGMGVLVGLSGLPPKASKTQRND